MRGKEEKNDHDEWATATGSTLPFYNKQYEGLRRTPWVPMGKLLSSNRNGQKLLIGRVDVRLS